MRTRWWRSVTEREPCPRLALTSRSSGLRDLFLGIESASPAAAGGGRQALAALAALNQSVLYHAVIRVADDQLAGLSVRCAAMCQTARLLEAFARDAVGSVRQHDLPSATEIEIHAYGRRIHRLTS